MKYIEIENLLKQDLINSHNRLKALAPQDSEYVSIYRGKWVDFIFVDNVKTYTNTNHLYNSVEYRETTTGKGKDIVAISYVDGNTVPYYQQAVLSPTLLVARQYGKTEYGKYRVSNPLYVDEFEKDNRNYLYYMRGKHIFRDMMAKWDGKEFRVSDSIGDFE